MNPLSNYLTVLAGILLLPVEGATWIIDTNSTARVLDSVHVVNEIPNVPSHTASSSQSLSLALLVDTTGMHSNLSVSFEGWYMVGGRHNDNAGTWNDPDFGDPLTSDMAKDYIWHERNDVPGLITFGGLLPGGDYSLRLLSARDTIYSVSQRSARYTANGVLPDGWDASTYHNSHNDGWLEGKIVKWSSIRADASGEIVIDARSVHLVGSYANVNALSLTGPVPAPPPPPVVTTLKATETGSGRATLNGSVRANGSTATVLFEYGLTDSYGQTIAVTPASGNAIAAVSGSISGLTAGATYHYRVVATNAGGTTEGEDQSFVANTVPLFTSNSPTSITANPAGDGRNLRLAAYAFNPDPLDPLTWSIVSLSNPGLFRTLNLDPAAGNLDVIFDPWSHGSSAVTIRITDSFGALDEKILTFTLPSHPDPQLEVSDSIALNRQTGLYEHTVTVTNESAREIAGFDLTVKGLPAGIEARNASHASSAVVTNDHRQPVGAGASVALLLEYYAPIRGTVIDPEISVELVTKPEPDSSVLPGGLTIDRCLWQWDDSLLIEFASVPGALYEIRYSNDGATWKVSPVRIRAAGNRTQWIDRGPPRTDDPPSRESCRLYKVLEAP